MDYSRPLISICVITYNQERYIGPAIESALNQGDISDRCEIIVGDDASTDATPLIVTSLANRYPGRIRLVRSESNRGITGNCNAVVNAARGAFHAWLGGDDLMLPDKLSTQYNIMHSKPIVSLAYHNVDVFNDRSGKSLGLFNGQSPDGRGALYDRPRNGSQDDFILHGCFCCGSSVMVRSDSIPPGGFDARVRTASDWLYWIDTCRGGKQALYIDRILGRYRRHTANVTSIRDPRRREERLTLAIALARYPHNAAFTRKAFSRIDYASGIEYARIGKIGMAAKLLARSARRGWHAHKVAARLAMLIPKRQLATRLWQ